MNVYLGNSGQLLELGKNSEMISVRKDRITIISFDTVMYPWNPKRPTEILLKLQRV